MSEPMSPNTPQRSPLWMRILLFVSLAVNLLIAGLVVGSMFGGSPGNEGRLARDLGGLPFIRALPKEDQRAIAQDIWRNRDEVREGRAALRQRLDALMAAFAAEEFDRAEVEALLAEQRAQMGARQSLGEAAFLDHLETLSQAERMAFVDRLKKTLKRRQNRR